MRFARYDADHRSFPVSNEAMTAAAGSGQDFTFGTFGLPTGLKTPGGTFDVRALDAAGRPLAYQANNSEVMAVLRDVESWPGTPNVPTINRGHAKNPHHTHYLDATMSGDISSPGIGPDGVYRDPWGQPYVLTIDLNGDDKARDAFYCEPSISGGPRRREHSQARTERAYPNGGRREDVLRGQFAGHGVVCRAGQDG